MTWTTVQLAGARTGPTIALAVLGLFTLVGLYFLVRTRIDEAAGVHEEEATYVLGLGEHPALLEVPEDRTLPATAQPLGLEGLKRVIDLAERQGEIGVTALVRETGRIDPYELSRTVPEDLVEVELTASRGSLWIDIDGHVRARPPLDDAVREDLQALLLEVVDLDETRADERRAR